MKANKIWSQLTKKNIFSKLMKHDEDISILNSNVETAQNSIKSINTGLNDNISAISAVSAEVSSLSDNFNNLFVIETKSLTTTSNWCVVSKSGYHLIGAYTVTDDNTKGISNIQKRSSEYQYTLMFDGITSSTQLTVRLVWLADIF